MFRMFYCILSLILAVADNGELLQDIKSKLEYSCWAFLFCQLLGIRLLNTESRLINKVTACWVAGFIFASIESAMLLSVSLYYGTVYYQLMVYAPLTIYSGILLIVDWWFNQA